MESVKFDLLGEVRLDFDRFTFTHVISSGLYWPAFLRRRVGGRRVVVNEPVPYEHVEWVGKVVKHQWALLLLGVPFNWVGTAALQLMLAQQAGLEPGELVWMGGDVHLYLNHLDQAREQLARDPRPSPSMRLVTRRESIDDYRIDDFSVEGYDPHPPIKADVAV